MQSTLGEWEMRGIYLKYVIWVETCFSTKKCDAFNVVEPHVLNEQANHALTGFESSFESIRKMFL